MLPLFRHQTKNKSEKDIKNGVEKQIKVIYEDITLENTEDTLKEVWGDDINEFFPQYILAKLFNECKKEVSNTDEILKLLNFVESMFAFISFEGLISDKLAKIKETMVVFNKLKEICSKKTQSNATASNTENATYFIPKSQDVTSIFFIPVKDSDWILEPVKDSDWILKPVNKEDYRYYHKNNVGETNNKLTEFKNQGFGKNKRKAQFYINTGTEDHPDWQYLGLFELDEGNKKLIYWIRIK